LLIEGFQQQTTPPDLLQYPNEMALECYSLFLEQLHLRIAKKPYTYVWAYPSRQEAARKGKVTTRFSLGCTSLSGRERAVQGCQEDHVRKIEENPFPLATRLPTNRAGGFTVTVHEGIQPINTRTNMINQGSKSVPIPGRQLDSEIV
jgi:hypothetical protein